MVPRSVACDREHAVRKGLILRRNAFLASLPCTSFALRDRVRQYLHDLDDLNRYDEQEIASRLLVAMEEAQGMLNDLAKLRDRMSE